MDPEAEEGQELPASSSRSSRSPARSWPRGWKTPRSTSTTAWCRSTRSAASRPFGAPSQPCTHAAERQQRWPRGAVGDSTHDTKRGEDVAVAAQRPLRVPEGVEAAVTRWARVNRRHKTRPTAPVPIANDEYLLYQILLGAWPLERRRGSRVVSGASRSTWRRRPARRRSTPVGSTPNETYEAAIAASSPRSWTRRCGAFLPTSRRSSSGRGAAHQQPRPDPDQADLAGRPGHLPGQRPLGPDLVDPDNRRPVDYDTRRHMLEQPLDALETTGEPKRSHPRFGHPATGSPPARQPDRRPRQALRHPAGARGARPMARSLRAGRVRCAADDRGRG